jgi:predicted porin
VLRHQGEPEEVGSCQRPVEGLGVGSVSKLEIQMKKTWVALAVAGAFVAGAAQAQSSVTLYGIVDVNYMWQEVPVTVGTGTAARVQQESASYINAGHHYGSRWGLRGSEDLGGGLKAIFQLESGFNTDTGTSGQGGQLFGRQAYAGLSGGWGSLVAGRLASFSSGTGAFDMFSPVDPFGTGFGLASLGQTFISANSLRIDNTVAYVSPTFAGFKGGVGYSTQIAGNESGDSNANVTAFISGLSWSYGPFYGVVTYDAVDNIGSAPDQKHLQLGGTFTLGAFKLHAGYADQSNIGALPSLKGGAGSFITLPAGLANFDASSWMLGGTWTMGKFAVFGSYQVFDADSKQVGTVNYEPDYNVWGVGATYNFSARSNLYASYASRDADGTLVGNNFNAKQFAIGMAHKF